MRLQHIFLLTFLAGIVLQSLFWQNNRLLDKGRWIVATEHLSRLDYMMFDPFTYGYPGTAIMVPAIAISLVTRVTMASAFVGIIVILVALFTACATVIVKKLQPKNFSWIAVGATLLINQIYFAVTPPSAVIAPLFVLIALVIALVDKEKGPFYSFWLLGILLGVSASLRLDLAIVLTGPILAFVYWGYSVKKTARVAASAVLAFLATNPFMWLVPWHHLHAFADKLFFHFFEFESNPLHIALPHLTMQSALALLGFALALPVVAYTKLPSPLSRRVLVFLMTISAAITGGILMSSYQVLWYFAPVIMLWEVLLIILASELTVHMRTRYVYIVNLAFCLLIVFWQSFIVLYRLSIDAVMNL